MTLSKLRTFRTHKPYSSPDYNVLSSGFRGGQDVDTLFDEMSSRDTKPLIAGCGGSSTLGTGVKDTETWPFYLSTSLPTYQRINLGVGGFDNFEELHLLVDLISHGVVPEKVIFRDGVNEKCPLPVDRSKSYRPYLDDSNGKLFLLLNNMNTYNVVAKMNALFSLHTNMMAKRKSRFTCVPTGSLIKFA